jgi:Tol biopolymer transport system component
MKSRRRARGAAALSVVALVVAAAPAGGAATGAGGSTSRASVSSTGRQGNALSFDSAISAHGRYVSFGSAASTLVPGDTNGNVDVFVRDRLAGVTRRVSVGQGGQQANGDSSLHTAVSADGRYVGFSSDASNLVPGDTNDDGDAFVRDLRTGVTRLVSLRADGRQVAPDSFLDAMSGDGRHVVFTTDGSDLVPGDRNGEFDVYVRDRLAGVTRWVSIGLGGQAAADEGSFGQGISADGRYVTFVSAAPNLVAGDTNLSQDVFVRDRLAGRTHRVSVGPGGRESNGFSSGGSISADGRFVAFSSGASNLVPGDTNGVADVFVRDQQAGVTRRVSVGSSGRPGNNDSFNAAVSADGRYVAFISAASNLVAGDTNGFDAFVRDRLAGLTRRVSVGPAGRQANGTTIVAAISADGRHVTFSSTASNLVPGDTNGESDVFVRDSFGDPR